MNLDWLSSESYIFQNPKLKTALEKPHDLIKGHIYLATSGTESLKWVVLSKQAFLESAKAVNAFIDAGIEDIWLQALPHFHVGGLSIYARSYLSRAKVIHLEGKWNPLSFYETLKNVAITSLVPAQFYDLISLDLPSPKSLRVLFIGGAALSKDLYVKGRELGWPIYLTYGMTEACSQIAAAKPDEPLTILPHIQAKTDSCGRLSIKGPSLLTGYYNNVFIDPLKNGWFQTADKVKITNIHLEPLGRMSDHVKIGGEFVNISEVESLIHSLKNTPYDYAVKAIPDPRLGCRLKLFHNDPEIDNFLPVLNHHLLPIAKIRDHSYKEALPKSPLGKILKSLL